MDQNEANISKATTPTEVIELDKGEEFRFEVEGESNVYQVELKSGSAELFGVELAIDRRYSFREMKGAIYTWYGCKLETFGQASVSYTSDETPMNKYVNTHAQLEVRRENADPTGPKVLIAGPTDAGKSTLANIILNYAVRLGRKPIFVDLDVGQNGLSIPGTIAATALDTTCLSVEEPFILTAPLTYFYGHDNLNENPEKFRRLTAELASTVKKRMTNEAEVNTAGMVINTCGWVDGLGLKLLKECIDLFEVDIVLVVGQDRLYSELKRDLNKSTDVVKLDRSGGVVPRNKTIRRKHRMNKIREYFYGRPIPETGAVTFTPAAMKLNFDDVDIYQINDTKVSDAMLPVGQSLPKERLRADLVEKNLDICHSVVSLSLGTVDELINAPSAGFLYIKSVDVEQKVLHVLAPCPGTLPSRNLILGSIRWME